MLSGIVLNLMCGLLFASLGAVLGKAADKKIDVYSYYFWGSMFAFIWSFGLVGWNGLGSGTRIGELALWMFAGSTCNNAGHLLLYHNLKNYHRAASWAVGMSSLAVPFVASLLLWGEPLSGGGVVGLTLILSGIGFLAAGRRDAGTGRINLKWLGLASANLWAYGLAQVCMGVPSHWTGWSDVAHLRTPLSALFCGLQQWGILLWLGRRPEKRAVKTALLYSLIYLVALIGIYASLDILSRHGMSRIFWPLGSGTCIAAFTIYSHTVKKEHFSWLDLVGLSGIIIGLAFLTGLI